MDNGQIENLLLQMADGSTTAFEELYKTTKAQVYAFSLSYLKNGYDAEDVVQDTYISIYNSVGNYKPKGKPMAWIFTIAKNLCLMKFREQSKAPKINIDDFAETIAAPAEYEEDKELIVEIMKILKEDDLKIVMMHAVGDLKFREIAEILDLALPTVLSKYNRSIKKLRTKLEMEEI